MKKLLSDSWGFTAYFSEPTTTELIASRIILGPTISDGVLLGQGQPGFEVVHPFFELLGGAVGHATDEAGKANGNLGTVDDHALDRRMDHNLGGVGIEGHLVVGGELVEVIIAWGRGGGLSVHDEEGAIVFDDAVEMAGEEVGLANLTPNAWPISKLKLKTNLHRRLSVVELEGLGRIILKLF